jgi:hypothetical protein
MQTNANLSYQIYDREINRQSIILKIIDQQIGYVADLDLVESLFMRPLQQTAPPLRSQGLDSFIVDVFYNILDLRECNRKLLERLRKRQRENNMVISWVGDLFLQAVAEFREEYARYIGHLPVAEKRLDEEMKSNSYSRTLLEVSRQTSCHFSREEKEQTRMLYSRLAGCP